MKIACSENCETCYGGSDNQCLSCPNGKVLESGSCLTNCSNDNYPDQNNICQGLFYFIYFIYFLNFYFGFFLRLFIFFKKLTNKLNKIRMPISMFNMFWIRKWRVFELYFTNHSKWSHLYF